MIRNQAAVCPCLGMGDVAGLSYHWQLPAPPGASLKILQIPCERRDHKALTEGALKDAGSFCARARSVKDSAALARRLQWWSQVVFAICCKLDFRAGVLGFC